jgi:hypothetical protein
MMRRFPEAVESDMSPKLHFYSKPGCCLCDAALEPLTVVAREAGLEILKVDIEGDPGLVERHGQRIPVVELDGEVIAWGRISERAFRLALRKKGFSV